MSGQRYAFELPREHEVAVERVGNEGEPVIVVERALADPGGLVDYASDEVTFEPAWSPSGGYPGLGAPAPLNYVGSLVRALDPVVRGAFALEGVKLLRAECRLSMVTLRPDQLVPAQRVPHVDTVDPLQFAFLHYLCGPEHGGTSFYRHRATGFETLTAEREPIYQKVRSQEMEISEPQRDYLRGDTDHFVRTASFESRQNRLLIYRSRLLHSGDIPERALLSDDPRRGRLTANIFVNYARLPNG